MATKGPETPGPSDDELINIIKSNLSYDELEFIRDLRSENTDPYNVLGITPNELEKFLSSTPTSPYGLKQTARVLLADSLKRNAINIILTNRLNNPKLLDAALQSFTAETTAVEKKAIRENVALKIPKKPAKKAYVGRKPIQAVDLASLGYNVSPKAPASSKVKESNPASEKQAEAPTSILPPETTPVEKKENLENTELKAALDAMVATIPRVKNTGAVLGKAESHHFIERGHFGPDNLLIDAETIALIKKLCAGRTQLKIDRFYKRFDASNPEASRKPENEREKMTALEKGIDKRQLLEKLKKKPESLSEKELAVLLKLPFSVFIDDKGNLYAAYEGKRKKKRAGNDHKIIGEGSSKIVKYIQNLDTGALCTMLIQPLEARNKKKRLAQLQDMEHEAEMASKTEFHLGSITRNKKRIDIQVYGGETLSDLFDPKKEGFIDNFDDRLEIANLMLHSVAQMHTDHGILHRDLKVENIFYNRDNNELRIGDYGLAEPMPDNPNHILETHVGVGTPRILAPELADPAVNTFKYSPVTDTYAAGVALIETFGLTKPFLNFDKEITINTPIYNSIMHSKSPEIQSLRNQAWEKIKDLCQKMTVINPTNRLREARKAEEEIRIIRAKLNEQYDTLATSASEKLAPVLKNKDLSTEQIRKILRGCRAEGRSFPVEFDKLTPKQKRQRKEVEQDIKTYQEFLGSMSHEEKEAVVTSLNTLSEIPLSILTPRLTAALQKPVAVANVAPEAPAVDAAAKAPGVPPPPPLPPKPKAPAGGWGSVQHPKPGEAPKAPTTSPTHLGAAPPRPQRPVKKMQSQESVNAPAVPPTPEFPDVHPYSAPTIGIVNPVKNLADSVKTKFDELEKFGVNIASRFKKYIIDAKNIVNAAQAEELGKNILQEQRFLNKNLEFLKNAYKDIIKLDQNKPEVRAQIAMLMPTISAYEAKLKEIQETANLHISQFSSKIRPSIINSANNIVPALSEILQNDRSAITKSATLDEYISNAQEKFRGWTSDASLAANGQPETPLAMMNMLRASITLLEKTTSKDDQIGLDKIQKLRNKHEALASQARAFQDELKIFSDPTAIKNIKTVFNELEKMVSDNVKGPALPTAIIELYTKAKELEGRLQNPDYPEALRQLLAKQFQERMAPLQKKYPRDEALAFVALNKRLSALNAKLPSDIAKYQGIYKKFLESTRSATDNSSLIMSISPISSSISDAEEFVKHSKTELETISSAVKAHPELQALYENVKTGLTPLISEIEKTFNATKQKIVDEMKSALKDLQTKFEQDMNELNKLTDPTAIKVRALQLREQWLWGDNKGKKLDGLVIQMNRLRLDRVWYDIVTDVKHEIETFSATIKRFNVDIAQNVMPPTDVHGNVTPSGHFDSIIEYSNAITTAEKRFAAAQKKSDSMGEKFDLNTQIPHHTGELYRELIELEKELRYQKYGYYVQLNYPGILTGAQQKLLQKISDRKSELEAQYPLLKKTQKAPTAEEILLSTMKILNRQLNTMVEPLKNNNHDLYEAIKNFRGQNKYPITTLSKLITLIKDSEKSIKAKPGGKEFFSSSLKTLEKFRQSIPWLDVHKDKIMNFTEQFAELASKLASAQGLTPTKELEELRKRITRLHEINQGIKENSPAMSVDMLRKALEEIRVAAANAKKAQGFFNTDAFKNILEALEDTPLFIIALAERDLKLPSVSGIQKTIQPLVVRELHHNLATEFREVLPIINNVNTQVKIASSQELDTIKTILRNIDTETDILKVHKYCAELRDLAIKINDKADQAIVHEDKKGNKLKLAYRPLKDLAQITWNWQVQQASRAVQALQSGQHGKFTQDEIQALIQGYRAFNKVNKVIPKDPIKATADLKNLNEFLKLTERNKKVISILASCAPAQVERAIEKVMLQVSELTAVKKELLPAEKLVPKKQVKASRKNLANLKIKMQMGKFSTQLKTADDISIIKDLATNLEKMKPLVTKETYHKLKGDLIKRMQDKPLYSNDFIANAAEQAEKALISLQKIAEPLRPRKENDRIPTPPYDKFLEDVDKLDDILRKLRIYDGKDKNKFTELYNNAWTMAKEIGQKIPSKFLGAYQPFKTACQQIAKSMEDNLYNIIKPEAPKVETRSLFKIFRAKTPAVKPPEQVPAVDPTIKPDSPKRTGPQSH